MDPHGRDTQGRVLTTEFAHQWSNKTIYALQGPEADSLILTFWL